MASSQGHPDAVRALIAEVKTLINARLKEVLREERLTVSGVKSELQIRIIAHIEKLSNAGNVAGLDRVRALVKGSHRQLSSTYSPYATYTPPSSASPHYSSPQPRIPPSYGSASVMSPSGSYGSKQLSFKQSPFYTIQRALTPVVECRAREHTRDTTRLTIILTPELAEQLSQDPSLRVMVFCAAENPYGSAQLFDISFPHQVELKCNSDEVKANLRGLKNKPGSTRPADVTSLIRKKANYHNSIEMVYALTQKKFYLVVNLVQKAPVEELVARRKAFVISKEQVLREMTKRRDDPDIEATSTILSLKCPLSAMRISVPFRGSSCAHNACFDGASYLQLQEQAPQWSCPICNKPTPFESLQMDLYVDGILKSNSSSVEQVTVEPDGSWHLSGAPDTPRAEGNPTPDDDLDDDGFIEIRDDRISTLKQQNLFPNSVRTPPMSSREQSIASSAPRSSNKRPASEVIDLTLSDDDEAPPAKIKRSSMSTSDAGRPQLPNPYYFEIPRPNPPSFSSPFSSNS